VLAATMSFTAAKIVAAIQRILTLSGLYDEYAA
jgi:hypothetical protein